MSEQNVLLEIINLQKHFSGKKSMFNRNPAIVKAVDGVDLKIYEGETLGLVGESGCGKTTLGRTVLRLTPANGGEILFKGNKILSYSKKQVWHMRRQMQIVFQDPYGSLNPRMTVGQLVGAPLDIYDEGTKTERLASIIKLLEDVGLGEQHLRRYPHEFSGGQRQRIGIARAMILNPEFVVCDEPVSALDVSVRAQVLNLMKELQKKRKLTYLFISHDLSVVKHISDRIAVMYLGKIVELTDKNSLYNNNAHPYTKGLLSSIPIPDTRLKRTRVALYGDIPSSYQIPSGCRFHTRCPYAKEECKLNEPALKEIGPGHFAACHLV